LYTPDKVVSLVKPVAVQIPAVVGAPAVFCGQVKALYGKSA